MENIFLIPERRVRVLTVAFAAVIGLYVLMAFVAEPLGALGASSDSESVVVSITINDAIGLNCDADGGGAGSGETLSLASITDSGDTGPLNNSSTGTLLGTKVALCKVVTNSQAGWTLGWRVTTGSGGTKTGYMISQFEDFIDPFNYSDANAETTPVAWGASVPTAVQSAWGGRLSDRSDNFATSPRSWGADAADGTEKWLKVSSGSTVTVAQGNTETSDDGARNYIGFRVEVGPDKIQPSGTYKVTVNFTASNQ
jgi:hypothetical protein